jgi:hypothetical protein
MGAGQSPPSLHIARRTKHSVARRSHADRIQSTPFGARSLGRQEGPTPTGGPCFWPKSEPEPRICKGSARALSKTALPHRPGARAVNAASPALGERAMRDEHRLASNEFEGFVARLLARPRSGVHARARVREDRASSCEIGRQCSVCMLENALPLFAHRCRAPSRTAADPCAQVRGPSGTRSWPASSTNSALLVSSDGHRKTWLPPRASHATSENACAMQ